MQFKPETENVVVMSSPCPSTPPPSPLDEDQKLQRIRKIFLGILNFLIVSFYFA
jgi:hypothetical protein